MKRHLGTTRHLVFGVGLAALAVAGLAQAYLLPGYSILRRMTDVRDEIALSGLKVEGSATFYGPASKDAAAALTTAVDAQRPELSVDMTVSLRLPGRCRLEVSSIESGKRSAVSSSSGKRRSEGAEVPGLAAALSQICPLLAARSGSENEARAAVERHLAQLGVDSKKVWLGRFSGMVAYVLGDAAEGQSQLWIFKEGFQPARVRWTQESTLWDVRFSDYHSPATGDWYPRIVEVYRAGQLVVRMTSMRADAKPRLDDAIF